MKSKQKIQEEIKLLKLELKTISKKEKEPNKVWNKFLLSCTNGVKNINLKAKANLEKLESKEKQLVLDFIETPAPLKKEDLQAWQNKCAEFILSTNHKLIEEKLKNKLKETRTI